MRDIPKDKLHFYTPAHRNLRYWRKQLENSNSLAQLEADIVKESVQEIAKRGIEILITFDPTVYAKDLSNPDAEKVSLLCDEGCNLLDFEPLLQFVPQEKKTKYGALRKDYLSGN